MPKSISEIHQFILEAVQKNPDRMIDSTCAQFDLTRKAVGTHVRELVDEGLLIPSGSTRNRKYILADSKT